MMTNWHRGFSSGGPRFGMIFLAAGFLLFVLLVLFAAFLLWRRGSRRGFGAERFLSRFTTDELEAELAKRQSQDKLEAEVLDLKKQLAELKLEKLAPPQKGVQEATDLEDPS